MGWTRLSVAALMFVAGCAFEREPIDEAPYDDEPIGEASYELGNTIDVQICMPSKLTVGGTVYSDSASEVPVGAVTRAEVAANYTLNHCLYVVRNQTRICQNVVKPGMPWVGNRATQAGDSVWFVIMECAPPQPGKPAVPGC